MLQNQPEKTFVQDYYPFQGSLLYNNLEPDLFIRMTGDMRSISGFSCEQITSAIAVHVVWQGAGAVVINGKKQAMNAGDIFVFYPGLHIKHFDDAAAPWHYSWFSLHGARALWALEQCGFTPAHPCRPNGISAGLKDHVRLLLNVYRSKEYPPFFPMNWAWQFFGFLARQSSTAAPRTGHHWLAEACRSLIESEYTGFSSVDELSRKLEVERTTIFRHFKNTYGLSPKNYIESHKLKKAEQLLASTRLRVKEVSVRCGFNDANYFCRVFRLKYGASPEQWRQQQQARSESNQPGFEHSVNYADFEK